MCLICPSGLDLGTGRLYRAWSGDYAPPAVMLCAAATISVPASARWKPMFSFSCANDPKLGSFHVHRYSVASFLRVLIMSLWMNSNGL